jgi:tetratricopeptide (TPR) repeat protein
MCMRQKIFTLVLLIAFALTFVNCGGGSGKKSEIPDVNLREKLSYFSGGEARKSIKFSLLRDSINNRIALLCVDGASQGQLEKTGIDDLGQRLDTLIKGNVLYHVAIDGKYYVSFPVFVGEKRKELAKIVNKAVEKLIPTAEAMITRLQEALKDRQDMLFHVLWSRIIDEIWGNAWELEFPGGKFPDVGWVVYPEHPYAVGTNYYNMPGDGVMAATWSNHFDEHLAVVEKLFFELHQAAWDKPVKEGPAKNRMIEYGAFDRDGRFSIFTFRYGDSMDQLFDQMTREYAAALKGVFDYNALGRKFQVPADELFIVILHETAYAVFEKLHRSGKLEVPGILIQEGDKDKKDARVLFSLILKDPPTELDEAMGVFMGNGWHGSPEAVEKFKAFLAKEPGNIKALWFLGLSLYDLKEYNETVETFGKLAKLTENNEKELLHYDWSFIWIGHIYDILGEREKAILYYKKVLEADHDSHWLQMGQYNIGPITAKEWAKKRLETPFTRR